MSDDHWFWVTACLYDDPVPLGKWAHRVGIRSHRLRQYLNDARHPLGHEVRGRNVFVRQSDMLQWLMTFFDRARGDREWTFWDLSLNDLLERK